MPIRERNALAFATLYGVSAEWLLCGDDGLAIMRRRIERLKRRVSLKASAASFTGDNPINRKREYILGDAANGLGMSCGMFSALPAPCPY